MIGERPTSFANIPYKFSELWEESAGPMPNGLEEFPTSIRYTAVIQKRGRFFFGPKRESKLYSLYYAELESLSVRGSILEMLYHSRLPSNFSVLVRINRATGIIETFKYRGDELVSQSRGVDWQSAFVQATIMGPHPLEPKQKSEDFSEGNAT